MLRSHFLNGNTDFEVYIGGFYFSAPAYSLFLWKQISLQLNKVTYSIGIIGAGNMAWHLAHRFIEAGCKLEFIANRTMEKAQVLADELGVNALPLSVIYPPTDLLVISVSDDSIGQIAACTEAGNSVLVHTSGSIGIEALAAYHTSCGVFYPFQTLTRGIEVDFKQVPLCVEASNVKSLRALKELANAVSDRVVELNSLQRRILHLGGVMVNNFTNHLYANAFKLMEENGINPGLLENLLMETALKVTKARPDDIQTGPARRNNQSVIKSHVALLEKKPHLQELYRIVSKQIIEKYHGSKAGFEF